MENEKAMDTKLSFEEPKMEICMLKKGFFLAGCLMLCLFLFAPALLSPDATVSVTANYSSFLTLLVDGTDAGDSLILGNYSTSEACNFGLVDARGTAITGGDSSVNGQTGIPVDSAGYGLSSPYDPNCVGSFYPIFPGTGGNDQNNHPNACLGISGQGSPSLNFYFRVSAAVSAPAATTGTPVAVGQLKWKDDEDDPESPSDPSGYRAYTDFSSVPFELQLPGEGGLNVLGFHDYGLLVLYANPTGTVTWTILYTLSTT
jgi:hypothetical protein